MKYHVEYWTKDYPTDENFSLHFVAATSHKTYDAAKRQALIVLNNLTEREQVLIATTKCEVPKYIWSASRI